MENKGLFSERQEHNPREKAFADEWERENTNCRAIDYGWGTLQNLFIKTDGPGGRLWSPLFHRRIVTRINKRDRFIVATVIQWLGSNVGMSFLHSALKKCGYRIVKIEG